MRFLGGFGTHSLYGLGPQDLGYAIDNSTTANNDIRALMSGSYEFVEPCTTKKTYSRYIDELRDDIKEWTKDVL